MIMGAIGGIALTAFIAYLWASQSNKINLKLFMQVTGVFPDPLFPFTCSFMAFTS